jgi:hypothetical protein
MDQLSRKRSALLLGFDVDRGLVSGLAVGHLARCRCRRRCVVAGTIFHAVLEALDGAAQILVPKTMTTISSTISQCQMEKEPMEFLLTNCDHFRRAMESPQGIALKHLSP